MNNTNNISLTELQRVIRDKLYEAFPGFYYVIAEISEIKVNSSGHCYLELTDSEANNGKLTARARATIWAGKYRILNAMFESMTGSSLQAGMKILFKATVEYHELYGLSLNITDIDPKYTIGEAAVRREAIIRRLASEGILDMNQSMELSLYPRRIAIISSVNAAGYQDFMNHLTSNTNGYVFVTQLFDTIMQGNETENAVIGSLERIASMADSFDAVVIIRGGGSQTDLGWFDNYNIAYLVTQFPLPVISGIGHDKDLTVTDIVAWKSLKTPTAVADFLINRVLSAEAKLEEMAHTLSSMARKMMVQKRETLIKSENDIVRASGMLLRNNSNRVVFLNEKLSKASGTIIKFAIERVSGLEKELSHLNPVNVLRRGYTITSHNGKVIKDHRILSHGDTIITHFEKGIAESLVNNIKDKE